MLSNQEPGHARRCPASSASNGKSAKWKHAPGASASRPQRIRGTQHVDVEFEDIMEAVHVANSVKNPCVVNWEGGQAHARGLQQQRGVTPLGAARLISCLVADPLHAPRPRSYHTITRRRYLPQLVIAVLIPAFQQLTGINAIVGRAAGCGGPRAPGQAKQQRGF